MAVHYKFENRIAEITIDRQEVKNAMDGETMAGLQNAFRDVRDNPEVWVAIITGAGNEAFSSGADISSLARVFGGGVSDTKSVSIPQFIELNETWKPFIAAVNGLALAGGCELALACDIRIASENAIFGLVETKRGLIPAGGGTQRLARIVPLGIALEMLVAAKRIDAQEAYRIGLVNEVVPLSELMPSARALAQKICENGPLAVRAAKEATMTGLELRLRDGLVIESKVFSRLIESEDLKEGLAAFLQKRKPDWKAR